MALGRRGWLSGVAAAAATRAARAQTPPARVFDAQFHIFDPYFPLIPDHGFEPVPFPVDAYLSNVVPFNVTAGAVVASLFQGYDQAFMADALRRLGPDFVGVAQVPFGISDEAMLEIAQYGVRGLRFNMALGEAADFNEVLALAHRAHDVAGWHTEFSVDAATLRPHVDQLARLPAFSIDHLGLTEAGLPVVLDLVGGGAWVKANGFGQTDLNVPRALEQIALRNPNALVFGTDMPSTRARVPFGPADMTLINAVLGSAISQKVFWDNALRLYRVPEP